MKYRGELRTPAMGTFSTGDTSDLAASPRAFCAQNFGPRVRCGSRISILTRIGRHGGLPRQPFRCTYACEPSVTGTPEEPRGKPTIYVGVSLDGEAHL